MLGELARLQELERLAREFLPLYDRLNGDTTHGTAEDIAHLASIVAQLRHASLGAIATTTDNAEHYTLEAATLPRPALEQQYAAARAMIDVMAIELSMLRSIRGASAVQATQLRMAAALAGGQS